MNEEQKETKPYVVPEKTKKQIREENWETFSMFAGAFIMIALYLWIAFQI